MRLEALALGATLAAVSTGCGSATEDRTPAQAQSQTQAKPVASASAAPAHLPPTPHDWLIGADLGACTVDANRTTACALTRSGTAYLGWLAWNPRQEAPFRLPASARSYTDVVGNLVDLAGRLSVTVGPSPILIENL